MGIEVKHPGTQTTFQDLGRRQYQHVGVSVSGVMDELAHRIANLLVGNPPERATLEVTLTGPILEFGQETLIAISGADLSACINDEPISHEQAVVVPAGGRLSFGERLYGARAYIAVAGGYDIADVLGSRSTALMMGIGGLNGRTLRKGDRLGLNTLTRPDPVPAVDARRLQSLLNDFHDPVAPIRITQGRHWSRFSDEAHVLLQTEAYQILPQSNRMGYRLSGPALALASPLEAISEPVRFGTVQVPADGQPIVLMADRQTVGGYPRLAEVITIDLPRLAQRMPGERIRFELVDVQEARTLYLERQDALELVETTLRR